jgi:hypothetical protein
MGLATRCRLGRDCGWVGNQGARGEGAAAWCAAPVPVCAAKGLGWRGIAGVGCAGAGVCTDGWGHQAGGQGAARVPRQRGAKRGVGSAKARRAPHQGCGRGEGKQAGGQAGREASGPAQLAFAAGQNGPLLGAGARGGRVGREGCGGPQKVVAVEVGMCTRGLKTTHTARRVSGRQSRAPRRRATGRRARRPSVEAHVLLRAARRGAPRREGPRDGERAAHAASAAAAAPIVAVAHPNPNPNAARPAPPTSSARTKVDANADSPRGVPPATLDAPLSWRGGGRGPSSVSASSMTVAHMSLNEGMRCQPSLGGLG